MDDQESRGIPEGGPTDRRALLAGIGGLAAGAFLTAGRAEAGTLTPPAAPAPTGKTLNEVEPRTPIPSNAVRGDADSVYKITQSGSYYLTENISGVSGRSGIEVAADNVTIDLMGFEIVGVPGALSGITDALVVRSNISVLNGTLRNWPESGVRLAATSGGRLIDLTARDNGEVGLWIGGRAVVNRCVVVNNGSDGLAAGAQSVITECTANGNADGGITTGLACVVMQCSATFCSNGIILGDSGFISSCVSRNNEANGILSGNGSTTIDCRSNSNVQRGFLLGSNARIDQCASSGNLVGIETLQWSMITNCLATSNQSHGIVTPTDCVIRDNMSRGNGTTDTAAAGIRTVADCRIEGNTCIDNPVGIRVISAGSFIVRNICSGNTLNWEFDANNVFGPIVDRRTPSSAAVSGNFAPSSLESTDPNANFTY